LALQYNILRHQKQLISDCFTWGYDILWIKYYYKVKIDNLCKEQKKGTI